MQPAAYPGPQGRTLHDVKKAKDSYWDGIPVRNFDVILFSFRELLLPARYALTIP